MNSFLLRRTLIVLVVFTTSALSLFAQSPGGVQAGLTAWFKADAGIVVAGGTVTTWINQAVNPDLVNVTQNGGPSTLADNTPLPFNFNAYLQFNNGCFSKEALANFEAVVKADAGTIAGVGTGASCLATVTSNFTNQPCGANRCNAGTGYSGSEFGNTGPNWAMGVANAGRANLWGFRASTAATVQQENTFNGLKNAGSCGVRRSGAYRFAIGSFTGYYYGTGRIAEIVTYNRQLNPQEFSRLESYLAAKYGVTLGNTAMPVDYRATDGSLFWNASNTYQNRVTVTGRDDSSAFYQKQSRSVHTGAMVTVYNGNAYGGVFPGMNAGNTTAFSSNRSFLAIGDNNGDTLFSLCSPDGRLARMPRTWKVQVSGAAGLATIALPAANAPAQAGSLLVSADPAFVSGVTVIPLQDNGTVFYASYPFTNGLYFTFGTAPLVLNGIPGNPVCDGQSDGTVTLHPQGGATPISYSWNSNPPQLTQNLAGVVPGAYTVRVTHGNGCTFDSTIIVKANPPVWAGIAAIDDPICASSNGLIIAKGIGGSAPWTYRIDNAPYDTVTRFGGLAPGTYRVAVRDQYGCTADTTVTLEKIDYIPHIAAEVRDAWCDAGGRAGQVTLELRTGTAPFNYDWKEFPAVKEREIRNLAAGTYTVTVTDQYGCAGTISATVAEQPCCYAGIPNAFSPNGDGTNDQFVPVFSSPVSGYMLSVFNRWGQRVFYSTKTTQGWDGTMNGSIVDTGTYYYDLTYVCAWGRKQVNRKGDLVLVR
ncbi:gliding motility-associated C-terminal domain-containing protein [Taibaiella chishuiensis]|uniref:Gliding motility-associated-like protein n=1 Tax=Taibaiella chishuiensis TaxID=1434707 RepID=A0A2P8D8P0_9BACT|nr:gliding motility-associated C-terminal domain-containing protein [Taibaiella chishuiensis]PSK93557.1 gliding motility-associated-like protein [Taibaiella chishuiensis]